MNHIQKPTITSSPHARYKAAVKMRSRLKRASILGLFISVLSVVGVVFVKSQATLPTLPVSEELNEISNVPEDQMNIPVAVNNHIENAVDTSYIYDGLDTISYKVKGVKEENELISFIIEGRDPKANLKLDLGNGNSRDVEGDTVFYRYKLAGRFMSYLILKTESEEIKVDSQYFEIAHIEVEAEAEVEE